VDRSELYVNLNEQIITNISKSGEKSFFTFKEALNCSAKDLNGKLEYFRFKILKTLEKKKIVIAPSSSSEGENV
jgi:hypothetical protein